MNDLVAHFHLEANTTVLGRDTESGLKDVAEVFGKCDVAMAGVQRGEFRTDLGGIEPGKLLLQEPGQDVVEKAER
jgi:hypothetical protein